MKSALCEKVLIGLTGSIASGKSTALAHFKRLGAGTLSADEIVRDLYKKPTVCKELKRMFGSAEPARLAQHVFENEAARKKLEAFLHPLVWKEMQAEIKKSPARCIVLELPLLFEAGWENRIDVTVLICGSKKSHAARLKARGLSAKEYQKRLAVQLTDTEKIKRADLCVINDKTPQELRQKIAQLYYALKRIYHF